MTALALNKGNISVVTDFAVQDRTNGLDPYAVTTSNPRTETIVIRNPTAVTIVVTVDLPLAYLENSRTYTSVVVGTVTGNTASGTNAILDTLSMAAGTKATYTVVSTYDTTPQNFQNDSVPYATTTPILRLTETTQDSTTVTDQDPLEYPLRPVYLGTVGATAPNISGDTFFSYRTPSVSQVLAGLVSRMSDGDTQRVIDAIEMGYTMADIVQAAKIVRPTYVTLLPTLDANRYQQGQVVRLNGGEWHSSGRVWLPYGQVDPSYAYRLFTDLESVTSPSPLVTVSSGTGAAAAAVTSTANHPGVISLSAGTTTTGVSHIGTGTAQILPGTGQVSAEFLVNVTTLSTSGEEFIIRAGLFSTTDGVPVNGCYLEYDRLTSLFWRGVTMAASSATGVISTATVTAATWVKLRVEINSDKTSVGFYVNDALVGTNILTIPTVAMGIGTHIIKSAGTTARLFSIDYVLGAMSLATAR